VGLLLNVAVEAGDFGAIRAASGALPILALGDLASLGLVAAAWYDDHASVRCAADEWFAPVAGRRGHSVRADRLHRGSTEPLKQTEESLTFCQGQVATLEQGVDGCHPVVAPQKQRTAQQHRERLLQLCDFSFCGVYWHVLTFAGQ
jgi:hypothetical protein